MAATISGSYQRALKEIEATAKELRRAGIKVLSPQNPEHGRTEGGFVYLKKDRGTPHQLEQKHLDAISKSHFLYVVNPQGYLGKSALIEMGFALAHGIPVYASRPLGDLVWDAHIKSGKSIREIKKELLSRIVERQRVKKAQRAQISTARKSKVIKKQLLQIKGRKFGR